ncbi:NAD-dependent epimerase/dehydratase family protein [Paraburkholderia silvatlantica]|uniref:Nucleoside-diphosphate-sugar epimerase n=1 Tax=Paraburkholderia silvatlantica TaxID=321895 RepID=A0ABR6FJG8_9BURK|nr:NAD-dependent epimerase/dehydratase family protein [Paraburkholderia silvatlantica]MBB2926925.1 nucleoside-diphosphate-sugar epimerase [Paraburkholderia silvatlantica]PVY37453.1 nucleoside-diphosphate-sugar epimerase [Paraburkholderia silvatlantica]PXW42415.1 nucleoside-diphosphate-sugar epimerase [Paraburkholderia silvatlantica]TDR05179.1 nucleoside-diphosphate-sugar epimerase [Paraburkholderia silvatlantica]
MNVGPITRQNRALVLGASGGIGSEVARQLQGAGWQVRALRRGGAPAMAAASAIEWLDGDVLSREAVVHAAQGCAVIVHAVNPPGYRRWAQVVLPMIDNTLAAAAAVGAAVVLPGTVYNFGPDTFPVLREDSPQQPLTRKGAIRVELERRMRAASEHGVRSIVVRAGDFFGPLVGNSWFAQGIVKPGEPVQIVRQPGTRGVGHAWSYVPDVARTMLELIERRETLPAFATFHMAGHWDADGSQLVDAICRVARRHGLKPQIKPFSWALARAISPFVTTLRELMEMRYLWSEPLQLDNARLVRELGREPHTPLDEAVEATLMGLNCLGAEGRAPKAA